VKQLKLSGKRWWLWTRWLGLAYLSASIALFLAQERLIFAPSANLTTNPATLNIAYQEVSVPVKTKADEPLEKMNGWWMAAQGKPIGTIVYFHSKSGNISSDLEQAAQFAESGLNVLMVDYRGYGQSEGSFPTERQIYADADAIWDYALKERKIDPRQTIIYGHSLGGAIAIYLAQKHPEAAGAIVHNTFTSISELASRSWQYKIFPIDLLLTQKFNSLDRVKTLTIPILYVHGTADIKIPSQMSRTLYTATASPNKQIAMVANGPHSNNAPEYQTPQHLETVRQFITTAIKTAPTKIERQKKRQAAR
jgi:uncharacterized protein